MIDRDEIVNLTMYGLFGMAIGAVLGWGCGCAIGIVLVWLLR